MRKWLVGCVAVVLVLVGALLPLAMPRRCPVTRAASEQIEKGMTQAEVHAILGGPPGDYRTRADLRGWPRFSATEEPGAEQIAVWHGDEVYVVVWSDSSGRAIASRCRQASAEHVGLLARISWRLEKLKALWLR
jgi:hypothetical protein